jgi:nitroreductase
MRQQAVTPLSALDAIFTRRSVRAYERRKIDDATVRSLLDAAVQAPTAVHMEPWAFVVIQDEAMLRRYSDLAKAGWIAEAAKYRLLHHEPAPGSGFAERLTDPQFSVFYDAGTLIVICAKPMGPFVAADCWLAAENLMLAASALGLGTCCIGSAVAALNAPDVKAELHIPDDVTVVVPIVVGVPAGGGTDVPRKEPEILFWKR